MKRSNKLLLVLTVFTVLGCRTTSTVKLTVTNPHSFQQRARVEVTKANAVKERTVSLGLLKSNGVVQNTFQIEHGGNFKVINGLPEGPDVGDYSQEVAKADGDPVVVDVALNVTKGRLLDGVTGAEQILNVLKAFGENTGYAPIDVAIGLKTIFGALIVITPADFEKGTGIIEHFKVNPGRFAPATTWDMFRYPTADVNSTVEVTGSGSAFVSAAVPIYGSLGVDASSDNAYKVEYKLTGFGMVEKDLPNDWNYTEGLEKLSPEDRKGLLAALVNNEKAIALFVNKIYVVKSGQFSIRKSSKLSAGSQLDALSVVTLKGAYKYEEALHNTGSYSDKIINITGIRIPLALAGVNNTSAPIPIREALKTSGASVMESVLAGKVQLISTGRGTEVPIRSRSTVDPVGGSGGPATKLVEIPVGSRVTSVRVIHGRRVNGIELLVNGKPEASFTGTKGSEKSSVVDLRRDEVLVGFKVTYGDQWDSVTVITSQRKAGPFGGPGGNKHFELRVPQDHHVVGLFGRLGSVIDSAGLIGERLP